MMKIVTKKVIGISVLLLILLFTGLSCAEDNTQTAENDQLELARELWGTDITYGDFIKQVFPDAYDKSPDDVKKTYYDTKMIWTDPSKAISSSEISAAAGDGTKQVYYLRVSSEVDCSSSSVEYTSEQRVWLPTPYTRVPFMSVVSNLWRDDGLHVTWEGVEYEEGNNVYKLEASDSYSSAPSGYYRVIGEHYVTWPVGAIPSFGVATTTTDWVLLS